VRNRFGAHFQRLLIITSMVRGFLLHLLEGSAIHVYRIISTWPEVEHGVLSVGGTVITNCQCDGDIPFSRLGLSRARQDPPCATRYRGLVSLSEARKSQLMHASSGTASGPFLGFCKPFCTPPVQYSHHGRFFCGQRASGRPVQLDTLFHCEGSSFYGVSSLRLRPLSKFMSDMRVE
jgi:hypothetical protein